MDLAGTPHVKPTKKISSFLERYFCHHDDMENMMLILSFFLTIAASKDNTWFLTSFFNFMNVFGENFAGSLRNKCMKNAIEGDCVEAVRIIHMKGRQTENHSAENIALAHKRGNTKIIQILDPNFQLNAMKRKKVLIFIPYCHKNTTERDFCY